MSNYECPRCHAEYSSPYAAAVCADEDEENDLRNRQWIAAKRKVNQ